MNYHLEILESFYKIKNIHFTKLLSVQLTHGECFALMKLKKLEVENEDVKVTFSDLANVLHVSIPSLSRTIKHLEELGYVIRIFDNIDRRNNFLKITFEGYEIVDNIEECMDIYCKKIYDKLGKKRVKEFIKFLNDLYEVTLDEIDKN